MNETIRYYDQKATDFFENTVSADMSKSRDEFLEYIPKSSYILDAGCGSGRDSKAFLEKGYRVEAIDASERLCELASAYIGQAVKNIYFEEIDYRNKFDGIWACASLLHIAKDSLPDVVKKFNRALKCNGVLYASFKYGTDENMSDGRQFSNFTEAGAVALLESAGFCVLDCYVTCDVRRERQAERWVNIFGKAKSK